VAPLIRSPHATVPDLVLRGLAVLAQIWTMGASSR
jgi:hypothetical protein